MEFEGKWAHFYNRCKKTLESRDGYDESALPMLERYVFVTQKLAKVSDEIYSEETTIKQTNTKDHTNEVSNPKMRIFVLLNKESIALAKELQLTPASLKSKPTSKNKKKGFDLKNPVMKAS